MGALTGYGTPPEVAAALRAAAGIVVLADDVLVLVLIAVGDEDGQRAVLSACVSACG